MAAERIGDIIYSVYDRFTGEYFNGKITDEWHDGTAMDDSKVDGSVYFKNSARLGSGYFKRTGNIITIDMFGADPTGTVSSSVAIQKAINFLPTSWELIIPNGVYLIDEDILIQNKTFVKITFVGRLITNNYKGLVVKNTNYSELRNVSLNNQLADPLDLDVVTDTAGIRFIDSQQTHIYLNRISGYKHGVWLDPQLGGLAYNYVHNGFLKDCLNGIYIWNGAPNPAYANEIVFDNIRVDSVIQNSWGVNAGSASGSFNINNIRVTGCTIERTENGFWLGRKGGGSTAGWTIVGTRMENVANVYWAGNPRDSVVIGGVGVNEIGYPYFDIDPDTTRNFSFYGGYKIKTLGAKKDLSTLMLTERDGGIGFLNDAFEATGNFAKQTNVNYPFWRSLSDTGTNTAIQNFNKQFDAPDVNSLTGTFSANSVIWQRAVGAGSTLDYFALMAINSGTIGTLVGVTATGTTGSFEVTITGTLADTVQGGVWFLIGGVDKRLLRYRQGNKLVFSVALTQNYTNATLLYSNDVTFKKIGEYVPNTGAKLGTGANGGLSIPGTNHNGAIVPQSFSQAAGDAGYPILNGQSITINGAASGLGEKNRALSFCWPRSAEGNRIYYQRYADDGTGLGWRRLAQIESGTTAQRPTLELTVGQQYFDTTLGKPIWWNGTVWNDATGATV